ncbi:LRR receptor-like serine/threonine-protein kinase GSO1-like protein [Corchorus olitorius]|uniref:LRR receptor-like serine/threonine-protein kinase GSO1-like protein n=1 Tax=Corchorus olitorius TaxID=93759 RepID=A0A1R3IBY1_9ROSI|nr:LRR receptor-like serine/threonine-protein kinase GSO1-like protein [Corchorus olitorius]
MTMDLSKNNLSGSIPSSLCSLGMFNWLKLNANNLSVELSTFLGRCKVWAIQDSAGNNCSSSANGNGVSKDKGNDEDESSRTLWIYISATLGFVVGFWAVFGTLKVKKSVRHAYFKSLDDIADKITVLITVNVARLKRKIGFERIQTQFYLFSTMLKEDVSELFLTEMMACKKVVE